MMKRKVHETQYKEKEHEEERKLKVRKEARGSWWAKAGVRLLVYV